MGVYFSERCFLFFIIYTALGVHETARRGRMENGEWLVISPIFLSILGKMFGI